MDKIVVIIELIKNTKREITPTIFTNSKLEIRVRKVKYTEIILVKSKESYLHEKKKNDEVTKPFLQNDVIMIY